MDTTLSRAAPRKVLIADDDPVTRTILSQCFKKEGFSVIPALDGVEACSRALSDRPDALVIDLLLPRRDGYSVLLFLRSRTATRELPAFILSGEASEGHSGIARTLGAQGYLTKPCDPMTLISSVKNILSDPKGDSRDDSRNR